MCLEPCGIRFANHAPDEIGSAICLPFSSRADAGWIVAYARVPVDLSLEVRTGRNALADLAKPGNSRHGLQIHSTPCRPGCLRP